MHALREHYVLTVAGWLENFERTPATGSSRSSARRSSASGGSTSSAAALAFRDGRMGVDQILMVRPGADHSLPLIRDW